MSNTPSDPYAALENMEPGQESFSSKMAEDTYRNMRTAMFPPMFGPETPMMGPGSPKGKEAALMIRTSDKKNFRIYMKAEFWFTQSYINGICRFLDTRSEGETVTFILGTKMMDWQTHMIGAVVSSMQSCKATINCVAAGYCSIPETMIWCFGQNRDLYRYGALSFCKTEFLNVCTSYKSYFEVFFKKAQEIGILTEEDVAAIWETGKEKMIMYHEYKEKFPD